MPYPDRSCWEGTCYTTQRNTQKDVGWVHEMHEGVDKLTLTVVMWHLSLIGAFVFTNNQANVRLVGQNPDSTEQTNLFW